MTVVSLPPEISEAELAEAREAVRKTITALTIGGDTITGLPREYEAILGILLAGPMYSTDIAKQLRTRGFQGWWAQEVGSAMRGLRDMGLVEIAERGAVHLWQLTAEASTIDCTPGE